MACRECPLCNKKISNFLNHLRFIHDITDPLELVQAIQKISDNENLKNQFAKYVEELLLKKSNHEITSEKYRELITKWIKENR